MTSMMAGKDTSNAATAHTAEHAFIGSLQKLLGQTLKVRKVSHNTNSGISTAFIVIPFLDVNLVARAELEVNSMISKGRKIIATYFESLTEAKSKVPNLRANEERITGRVRVVEIEGHDVSACAMEHAENLKECDFFLITRISKSGTAADDVGASEYEVDFAVGTKAKEIAIDLSVKLQRVCSEVGANINTLENTIRKLKAENAVLSRKARFQSRERLATIAIENIGDFMLLKGIFYDLVDDEIMEFAGRKILDANRLIIIINISDGSEMANIVFARSKEISKIDCNKVFREVAGSHGRGGGKPHFVVGVIKKEESENLVSGLSAEVNNLLRQD